VNQPGQKSKQAQPEQRLELKSAVAQSRDAARRSLDTYRKLIVEKEGPGAMSGDAKLGEPLAVVWIGLNELREPPGGDPVRVLRNDTNKVLYPILSADRVTSGVTFQKRGDKWEATAYGNATLTRLLVQAREKYAANNKKAISDFFAVSIPALNTHLLATKADADVTLIPVIDDPSMGLKAGVAERAKDLMPRFVEVARKKRTGVPR
jgi:hypothetical protein